MKLTRQAIERITPLRNNLHAANAQNKQMLLSVDGNCTNAALIKNLPDRTTIIGRIRKYTKLYALPKENNSTGRHKKSMWCPNAHTRTSKTRRAYYMARNRAWTVGKSHVFHVKVLKDLKWKSVGKEYTIQIVFLPTTSTKLAKMYKIPYIPLGFMYLNRLGRKT